MEDPILYEKGNSMSHRDAMEMFPKYLNMVKWRNTMDETVLDVGCAGGDVTWDILKPRLPRAARVFAADISQVMITYASKTYPDINFFVLDIGTKILPSCWITAFDHVMSFYCLHWIHDQRQAFQNIYNMLKPNGDLFTYYIKSNPYFDAFFNTYQLKKWKPYISDEEAHKYIAPYQYESHVEEQLNEILTDVGFNVSVCEVINKQYIYSSLDALKDYLMGINPHVAKIPTNLKDDFMDDIVQELFKLKTFLNKTIYENSNKIVIPYSFIVIFATKGNINEL